MTAALRIGLFGLVLSAAVAVAGVVPALASAGSGAPAIRSDQPDYSPGATVTLNGDGWGMGEIVHINVNDSAGSTWSRDADVTADFLGNITDQFVLPDWFIATYTVTATAPSGTATTTFTDGNVKARTNAGGFTFRLDWTRHSGTSTQPQSTCNAPGAQQTSGFEPAVGFSGGAQFSDGVPSDSSEVLQAADVASDGRVFVGWTGETASDTFIYPPPPLDADPHYICVPGDFTGSRTYVANYAVNTAPTVTRNNASLTVNEGQTATNSGTFSDAQALDSVTITASVGTITQSGTNSGTWSWSFATTDGPVQSQTVTITAKDNHGATSTTTFSLTVNNVAPTATFPAVRTLNEGSSSSFAFTSPSDPSSADTSASFHYAYSCTGASLAGATYASSGTATSVSCSFDDGPSSPTVRARIIDKDDGFTEYTTAVTVSNVAPTATFPATQFVNEGSPTSFSFTSPFDPSSADTTAGFHYAFSCTGASLAGATYAGSGTATSVTCTFPDGPSTETVVARIIDKDGGFTEYTTAVTVNNVAPQVNFTSAPFAVNEGSTHTYTYSISDPGVDTISSVTTSCGANGTKSNASNTSTSGTFDCTFPDGPAGSTVSVQVTDSDGATGTAASGVSIANVAPTVAFTSAPASVDEGSTHTYTYSISDPGADTVTSVATSCGANGTKSNASNTNSSGSFDCTFPDGPASSTVSAQATDSDGDAGNTASQTVAVANVAPTVSLTGQASVNEGSSQIYSFTTSDPGADTFVLGATDCGTGGSQVGADTFNASTGAGSFECSFPDGPASPIVSVTVSDSDGASDSDTLAVTVDNVKPSIVLTGDAAADEGSTHTYSYTVTDPGQDTHTITTDCGANGAKVAASDSYNAGTGAGSFKCFFADGPATTNVTATVTDSDGASDTDNQVVVVTVSNVAPTVSLTGDATVAEGSTHTYSFTTADPGEDTFTLDATDCGTGGSQVGPDTFNTSTGAGSFECSFPDGPASPNISVTVSDSDGASDSDSLAVTVNNVAPTVSLTGDASAAEGSMHTYGFTTTDPGNDTFVLDSTDCGTGGSQVGPDTFSAATGAGSFECNFPDGPASPIVSVTVSDSDGASDSDTLGVTVNNVAPIVALSGPNSANPGDTKTYTFTINDPAGAADAQSYVTGYPTCGTFGTVSGTTITYNGGSFQCTFSAGLSSTVAVKVNDGDANSNEDSIVVSLNRPPSVDAGANASGPEGTAISLDGTVSDPDGDTFTVKWTYTAGAGVDTGATCAFADDTAVDTTITCTDDGTFTAKLEATDQYGAKSSDTTTVTVSNANPVVTAPNPTPAPYAKGTTVSLSVNFTDAGKNDTHKAPAGGSCTVSWDDATPNSTGVVTEPAGSTAGSCTASHSYAAPGVYTVTFSVTDDDGGSGTATIQVVVYDPNGGFITGGGWINVGAGSYTADPTLSGRANFGFMSQYKKNSMIPTGETEFNFQVGNMNFHSTAYTWLVVSGYKAQYKGTGTINGSGNYDFTLTAYDGNISGGGGTDRFRIRITGANNGNAVIFDNRNGLPTDMDTADPQIIAGGSIVIHKA